jgi:hypothetical protein
MSTGNRNLLDEVSTWSPVESVRKEMIEGEVVVVICIVVACTTVVAVGVVCMTVVTVVDVMRNVEVVTENKAIHLSNTSDKIHLHSVLVAICVVATVDIIPAKH